MCFPRVRICQHYGHTYLMNRKLLRDSKTWIWQQENITLGCSARQWCSIMAWTRAKRSCKHFATTNSLTSHYIFFTALEWGETFQSCVEAQPAQSFWALSMVSRGSWLRLGTPFRIPISLIINKGSEIEKPSSGRKAPWSPAIFLQKSDIWIVKSTMEQEWSTCGNQKNGHVDLRASGLVLLRRGKVQFA